MFTLNPAPKKQHKRRAPKRGVSGNFTTKVRQAIIERDNGLCVRCGRIAVDIHHVQFRSAGGEGTIDNGASVCRECHDLAHRSKEVRQWFEDWKARLC